jgi:hypothetical protein
MNTVLISCLPAGTVRFFFIKEKEEVIYFQGSIPDLWGDSCFIKLNKSWGVYI